MALVSVVIPTYNCALFIKETIDSILSQTDVPDLEVIVVDDGSIDDTPEIARSFGDPVRVVEQTNSGVSRARNRGISESKGDFIALVDHDDYWLPSKLSNQIRGFAKHPEVDVVFSGFVRWHPDSTGSYQAPSTFAEQVVSLEEDETLSGWIYHQMLLDSQVLTSTALARATVYASSGGFDESLPFSEDWEFWLRVSRHHQFLKLKEKTTLYRQHPNQGSRVNRPIDYRTRLLEQSVRQWGLCSRDGRCISAREFRRQLAVYSAEFGLGHMRGDRSSNRCIAARALLKAWSIDRSYLKSLGYLAAMTLGWRP